MSRDAYILDDNNPDDLVTVLNLLINTGENPGYYRDNVLKRCVVKIEQLTSENARLAAQVIDFGNAAATEIKRQAEQAERLRAALRLVLVYLNTQHLPPHASGAEQKNLTEVRERIRATLSDDEQKAREG